MKYVFRALTRLVLIVTALAVLFFAWAYWVEPHRMRVENVRVGTALLPESAQGLRICAFSDTHLAFGTDAEALSKYAEMIREQKPDVIVFLGDLYDNYHAAEEESREEEAVIAALSSLSAPLGKYAVCGNHDFGHGDNKRIRSILSESGFTVLLDETVYLPEYGLSLYGVRDRIYGSADLGAYRPRPDAYNIVLCHEPDTFDELEGVDLMLSGHTHGGQIRLPLIGPMVKARYGTKYVSGLYTEKTGQVYVTRGVGMTNLMLRFLCPPEITILTLENPEK